MIQGIDVALYFIGLDSEHKVFNKRKRVQDGRCFYVGCERLIHYMHMAQWIVLFTTNIQNCWSAEMLDCR